MPVPIAFRGTIPMKDVPDFMRRADILVLPSITTKDGWGAVISEALLAGACVIASNRVGGSICLDANWRGRVIDRLTPIAVALAIDSLIDSNCLDEASRERRAAWANARLTGAAGARYLLAILSHVYEGSARPAPFYADNSSA
jgi:glycosyltransferase involved in cell wall biosynthesis